VSFRAVFEPPEYPPGIGKTLQFAALATVGTLPLVLFPSLTVMNQTAEGEPMHRGDIMKADLLSEIVLLASGIVLFLPLLLLVLFALTHGQAAY
jgi:hypothetical protein